MRGIETFVCSTIYIYTCIYVSIFYSKEAEATFFFWRGVRVEAAKSKGG